MLESEVNGVEPTRLNEEQERGKELFENSFHFSQGNQELHRELLKWLVVNGYFDNINTPAKSPDYIENLEVPKNHRKIIEPAQTFRFMWFDLHQIKRSNDYFSKRSNEEFLVTVLDGMIEKDLKYQQVKRPNRPRLEQIVLDPKNDPHASFVREYALNAYPTDNDAFDELHRSLNQSTQHWHTVSSCKRAVEASRDCPVYESRLHRITW
jgi:hypothetical protein